MFSIQLGTETISLIWKFNRKDYLAAGNEALREVKRTLTIERAGMGTAWSWWKVPKEERNLEGPLQGWSSDLRERVWLRFNACQKNFCSRDRPGLANRKPPADLWAAVKHRSKKKTLGSGRKSPLPAMPLQCFLLPKFNMLLAGKEEISVSPAPISQSWGKEGWQKQ